MKSGLDLARCASRKYAPTEVPDLKSWSPRSYEPCVSSFLTELPRFENSQNVKMRDTRDLPRFYYSFRNHTSMFSQFRKRGNDSSTLFRTALLVASPESRSFVSSTLEVS